MSQDWIDEMLNIVTKILERRDSEAFRKPVEWEELGLTDYLQIIKHPRDLGTIDKTLKKMQYQRRQICIQDIRLVWSNAMKYNLV
jgi:hypothetical protein